jgi:hypothetical protein
VPAADVSVDFELARAADAVVTSGRVVDVLSGSGLPNISIGGDAVLAPPSGPDGSFAILAAAASDPVRRIEFSGAEIVTRQTSLAMPRANVTVSLIPRGFDLRAFDEMLRTPMLRRWTTAPPLLIERRVVQFADVSMSEAVAAASEMSDAEHATLLADLTWALPQMTGGAFHDFAGVTTRTAAAGSTVSLLAPGSITVVWVAGLTDATASWGWSRWLYGVNGVVVGGLVMLDEAFERSGSPYRRSLNTHELGHALGYEHVFSAPSVMNIPARLEPNAFDLAATRIAFERSPGNRSPDVDPDSAQVAQLATGAVWSAAVP